MGERTCFEQRSSPEKEGDADEDGTQNEAGRRSLFCCHYARLGDVAEAARCAGYPAEHAAAEGAALLRQASCRRMVEAYRSALQGDPAAIVRAGLERLAFGRTNDVIQLLLAEEPMTGQQIQALDLFPVASLKRDKSGGMEVHFSTGSRR